MKKLFIAVMAVATLASCAQEEIISYNEQAIEFGDAFVNNSTKAIYENGHEVQAFQVWGTVTGESGTVALYDGANVTRPDGKAYGDAWTCDVQRFWTPNCNYAFYAVVDAAAGAVTAVEDGNPTGVPTSIAYTADGTTDLLYGATTKNVGADASNPGLVAFTMHHLLSKVSFKFTNTNTNTAYDYKVTSVKVSGAYASGTYTIDHKVENGLPTNINGTYDGAWGSQTGTMAVLSFLDGDNHLTLADATVSGDNVTASTTVAPKSFVIIPGTPALSIAITVETLLNGTKIYSKDYTLMVNQDGGTAKEFEKNTHYNFVVALEGGTPIDFTIGSVGGFSTPATDVTIQ